MFFRISFIIAVLFYLVQPGNVAAQANPKESDQLDFAQGLLTRGYYDMAIQECQKFITNYPHSSSLPAAYLSLGEGYFLSQNFSKAVDVFNQFKQLFPQSDQMPVSVLRLGQIDIEEKNYDDALKQLTSIDPKNLSAQMLQSFDYYTAQAYLGKSDLASALDNFQKAANITEAHDYRAYAYEQMGRIDVQNAKYSDAEDVYAKALALSADNDFKGELTYRTAEAQFMAGQYNEAINGFENVLEQFPNHELGPSALTNLLLSYFNLGQYDQLIKEYQKDGKIIKDDESSFDVHFAAVLGFIELKQYDQANTLLDHMLTFASLKPQETAKIYIKKADILFRQKKFQDALTLLDAHPAANEVADEWFFLEAQSYFGLGNYDKAFNCYENVYLNYPSSRFYQAALLGQAHTRQKTNRFKEAESLFKKYYEVQADPNLKSEALYDAVIMAQKAGEINNAIDLATEYLKAFPNGDQSGEVLLILADNYGNNNQPQDAAKLLQGYLNGAQAAQRPNAANFLLGFNEQSLGHDDVALIAYQKVDKTKEDGKFYSAALKNMAIIYLNQKKYDEARQYFDQLISQAATGDLQVTTYVWVCNEYLKLQKYDDVLRVAAQAEKNFTEKDLEHIHYFEAEALRALGRCSEAVKDYALVTASVDKDAYTGSSHIGNGLCLAVDKQYDEATQEFQKALDENADDYTVTVHARFEMANMDVTQGKLDEALKLYLLVATIYDDEHFCSESLLAAGKILEQQAKKEEALKVYQEILDKYKNSPAGLYAQARMKVLK